MSEEARRITRVITESSVGWNFELRQLPIKVKFGKLPGLLASSGNRGVITEN